MPAFLNRFGLNQAIKMKFSPFYFLLILAFAGCDKDEEIRSYETKINYTYSGQNQSSTSSRILTDVFFVSNTLIIANFTGLEISAPPGFTGSIFIFSTGGGTINCAYLQPNGISVGGTGTNCILHTGGNPIDSVNVYWYESGSLTYSYNDCFDIGNATIPGQKDCAVNGNFNLTLTNKNNQKIVLTNGSFSGRIRRYP